MGGLLDFKERTISGFGKNIDENYKICRKKDKVCHWDGKNDGNEVIQICGNTVYEYMVHNDSIEYMNNEI